MFVNFFIRRPVFATVCSLLIVLAGAVSIPTMPIAQFPDLAPPQVTVSAFYTGANAQAVETSVTTLLEQAINGAEGMRYSNSTSSNDGASSVTATFDLDRNLDLAAVDIQNRASTALGRLPKVKAAIHIPDVQADQAYVEAQPQRMTFVRMTGARASRRDCGDHR